MAENSEKEKEAYAICEEKIRLRELPMKLISVEYTHDVNKIISPSNRYRIQINPKKVWQETVKKERYNNVSTLLNLFETSGYKVN